MRISLYKIFLNNKIYIIKLKYYKIKKFYTNTILKRKKIKIYGLHYRFIYFLNNFNILYNHLHLKKNFINLNWYYNTFLKIYSNISIISINNNALNIYKILNKKIKLIDNKFKLNNYLLYNNNIYLHDNNFIKLKNINKFNILNYKLKYLNNPNYIELKIQSFYNNYYKNLKNLYLLKNSDINQNFIFIFNNITLNKITLNNTNIINNILEFKNISTIINNNIINNDIFTLNNFINYFLLNNIIGKNYINNNNKIYNKYEILYSSQTLYILYAFNYIKLLHILFKNNLNFSNTFKAIKNSYLYIYYTLINSLYKQYKSQNIILNIKNFEVILKKTINYVKIFNNNMYLNINKKEIINLNILNLINKSYKKFNLIKNVKYIPILVKINNSPLASVSFQKFIKFIISNTINKSYDWLVDIKSNIITNNMVPISYNWINKFNN